MKNESHGPCSQFLCDYFLDKLQRSSITSRHSRSSPEFATQLGERQTVHGPATSHSVHSSSNIGTIRPLFLWWSVVEGAGL
jgi:hypothetical protein